MKGKKEKIGERLLPDVEFYLMIIKIAMAEGLQKAREEIKEGKARKVL